MMKQLVSTVLYVISFVFIFQQEAVALDLNWSGQFRAESHILNNYSFDGRNLTTTDADHTSRVDSAGNPKGYYIPTGGSDSANFQSLFLKLRPSLVVNDNVYIKSEWWLGNPIYGFFGSASPHQAEQRRYNSNFSRGSVITAQRYWAELLTDFGTLQIGRTPLDWGLGLVWNSGDDIWDRYSSTGDSVRLISKFGSFMVSPAIIKYGMGNNVGGTCVPSTSGTVSGSTVTSISYPCTVALGEADVTDYSLMFKYENLDQDFVLGLNFIKRIANVGQESGSGYFGLEGSTTGMNFNTWDIYGSKKFGRFTLRGELPVTSGDIGVINYSTLAAALELDWDASDRWDFNLKMGHVPGQPSIDQGTGSPGEFKGFYFHHNYQIGKMMFNYQFRNFGGPNTRNNSNVSDADLVSIYDNPLSNAKYVSFLGTYTTGRWSFKGNFVWARANQVAEANKRYFHVWDRQFKDVGAGVEQQSDDLGWEMNYGIDFKWDDSFILASNFGWFFPGSFYEFANSGTLKNRTEAVFGMNLGVGIEF